MKVTQIDRDDGFLIPERPGHGMALQKSALARYRA
jgi:hypothetical protein